MILRDRGGVFPQGSPEHFVKVFFLYKPYLFSHGRVNESWLISRLRFPVRYVLQWGRRRLSLICFFCVTSHKSNGRSDNRKPAISDDKSYLVTPESTLKLREVGWTWFAEASFTFCACSWLPLMLKVEVSIVNQFACSTAIKYSFCRK